MGSAWVLMELFFCHQRTGTRRRYQDDGISDDEIEGKRTFDLDEKLRCDRFNSDLVKHMEGKGELTKKDIVFNIILIHPTFNRPIFFHMESPSTFRMPDPDFSVGDVKLFVGSRRIVDVMDVNTQKGIEMSMAQWRRYYETPPSEREKLYNVISLEFSHTKLENLVKRPASVDLIDWVDNMWPPFFMLPRFFNLKLYCLMSVQGCFTDFHIDFGGTSVWYHILRGGKVFWLIPPTPQNLEMYENWVLSGKQGDIFLGDKCHDCQRIELKQGNTFMIPSGWIHAVYTPEDTLVFGGNFLHSFNIPMQLNIYSIEDRTRVPAKFRYPFYYEMCWYVLERYLYCLTNISHLTPEFQKYSLGIGKEEVKEEEAPEPAKPQAILTPFELEGLWNLLGKLEELPAHKKCVPAGIRNAPALLQDMRALLQEHSSDNPKLSYTGEPIVKWPKRPSWYQPPTPPPAPVLYRPRLGPTLHKTLGQRPVKSASSISALRRRRVRCKRCAACCRKECGTCQYCHDMRKFGGPGRMKKSCIMRQCLAPALPNTARCAVCGEGESEESNASTHTLMECSICAQIAHPECIKEPGEGRINKDLPSCWECPKCYQGKDSASEVPAYICSSYSFCSSLCLNHSLLLWDTHSLLKLLLPRFSIILSMHSTSSLKLNLSPFYLDPISSPFPFPFLAHLPSLQKQSSLDRSPRLLGSRVLSRLRSPTSRLSRGRGRGTTWASGSPYRSSPVGTVPFQHQQQSSSSSLVLEPRGEPRRGRGRGVRLRGGGAGRGIRGGRSHGEMEEESEDNSTSSSSSSSDDEEEEDRSENGVRGGDKENQPHARRGGRTAKEREEEANEVANQNGTEEEEEEEMEQDSQSGDRDVMVKGSYLKVTLQKPSRAKRDPSAIVPKLEAAISPRTATSTMHSQSRAYTPPHTRSKHTHSHSSHSERLEVSKRARPVRPAKLNNGASSSSSSQVPPLRIPLSALQEGGSEADRENGGSGPGCEREVWVSVFRYLSRADLCVCMAVCKNWYKWCLDKRLWSRIDLSIKRTITPQALTGIIKRQPVTLDLSWTNISKKQLSWLIDRLPGLKDLMLSGCSWSSISALSSPSCPLLRSLDLRFSDGVKDSQIRDLVIPPGCDNRSQLRTMQCFRLAGLDISDSTLRLVIRHMPHLTRLDLSHCNSLTDHSINLLTAVGSSTRNTLTELNLGGCSKLTDTCLKYLRRLSCISLLDLRGCKGVSRKACESFISELSVNTLYCLSDEKLIQRIS
uniref:[histone H3]-dimethyl-L-lysine(36) demethylase n=1 Tax=Myripristis murdjan TaxID=586833 RepID=A0A667XU85_9TELE